MGATRLAELPDVLTVAEAASFLRIGRNTVYEAARRGDLPTIRIGRRVLFSKAALVELLAQARMLPGTTGA